MSTIKVLHPDIIKKIAAGEVIERPASIVKELVENSVDAGATSISVEIKGGGIQYIRVSDNGSGIAEADIPLAFLRHATSKIENDEDLDGIRTLGFRGEALFSIAAVSQTEVESKQPASPSGYRVINQGGSITDQAAFACSDGTSVTVKNVFFNMPARLKFLKAAHLESAAVGDTVTRQLLGNPHIAFRFSADGRELYHSPGTGDLKAAIHAVYGADTARNLVPVECRENGLSLHGYIGTIQIAQPNRGRQYFYVNGRHVEFPGASFSVQQAYGSRLMVKRYPFFVLYLEVETDAVDVNVHPQKLTVRFSNEKAIKDFIYHAVSNALNSGSGDAETALPAPPDAGNASMADGESVLPSGSVHQGGDSFSNGGPLPWEKDPPAQKATVAADMRHQPPTPASRPFIIPDRVDAKDALREVLVEGRNRKHTGNVMKETTAIGEIESTLVSSAILLRNHDYIVVGQAFDTYLIIQMGGQLLLIDQHAAHERILYDRFMQAIAQGKTASQGLLVPYILHLSPNEYGTFLQYFDILRSTGFELEEFGGYTVRINAVPYLLGQPQLPLFFEELLSGIDEIRQLDSAAMKKDAIIRMACRKAIKAGDKLTAEETETILDHYGDGKKQLTCPHGRPIVLAIEKKALEKGFKRLV